MTNGEHRPGGTTPDPGDDGPELSAADAEALAELLARELAEGPVAGDIDAVIALALAAGLAAEAEDEAQAEVMVAYAIGEIARDLDLIWQCGERVALLGRLLDERLFTHRLTEREVEDEAIEVGADWCLLDYGRPERLLPDGTVVTLEIDWNTGLAHLYGPAGWLNGWAAGDLIGLRRTGGRLALEHVATPADGATEAAVLLHQLQETLDLGYGDEVNNSLLDALLISAEPSGADPAEGLFRRPVPPISELLMGAGLTSDGLCFGPGERIWQRRFGAGAIQDILADRYGLDPCCLAALDTVTTGWRAHVLHMETNAEAPALTDVITALGHGDVAAAFADQVSFPYDRAAVGGYVEHLLAEAAPDATGPHLLAACLAEQHDDLEPAERHYRAVVAVEPHPIALLGLVDFAIDRSDFPAALQLLSQLGDDENPDIDFCRYMASLLLSPRRNDPCPCGSGRKYKACHDPRPFTDPDRRLTVLCRKLARFAAQYGSMVEEMADHAEAVGLPFRTVLEIPLLRDSWLADAAVAARYRTRRGELLPPEEATLLDRLISGGTLRVLEVQPGGKPPAVQVRDQATGERFPVVPPDTDSEPAPGEVILARCVDGHIFGGFQSLDSDERRSAAVALLDAGQPTVADLLAWFADTFGSTAEGSASIEL